MAKRTTVATLQDLLRLTDCADVADLESRIINRTELYSGLGRATVVDQDTYVDVQIKTQNDERGFEIQYPARVSEFWSAVSDLDRYLADFEAESLPFAGTDADGSTEEERQDLLVQLATNWRLPYPELIDAIGGDWATIDVAPTGYVLDEDGEVAESTPVWLAAGDPHMVAIGITGSYVWVGTPATTYPGLAGPGSVDVEAHRSLLRDDPEFLAQLTGEIAETIKVQRRRLVLCWGCRKLRAPYEKRSPSLAYCRDCLGHHFGLIID